MESKEMRPGRILKDILDPRKSADTSENEE